LLAYSLAGFFAWILAESDDKLLYIYNMYRRCKNVGGEKEIAGNHNKKRRILV